MAMVVMMMNESKINIDTRSKVRDGRPSVTALLICILALSLFTLFAPPAAHAATGGNGRMYGQVLDGSKNNTPLAGQSVTLQMTQNGTAQDLKSVKTDGQGNFSFSGLATDKSI